MANLAMDCGSRQFWLVIPPISKSAAIFRLFQEKIAALLLIRSEYGSKSRRTANMGRDAHATLMPPRASHPERFAARRVHDR